MNTEQALNYNELMVRLMDDKVLAHLAVYSALGSLPDEIAGFRVALQENSMETAYIRAHSIKGAAGSISADELFHLAKTCEGVVESGDLEGAERLLIELMAAWERLRSAATDLGWDKEPSE